MLIDKSYVAMEELDAGARAGMRYGRCPLSDARYCFVADVETQLPVRTCEFFDSGNPADDEPQCTFGIDMRPLP
jgi:hypothetical protein